MADLTKTIGSASRNYATPALWIAAQAANVVTSGSDNFRGEAYNDSEFTASSTLLTISGFTTNAAHQIIFTAAAGQSYIDNASVRTNALKYNQSNGVGLRTTAAFAGAVIVVDNAWIQVTRIQAKCGGVDDRALSAQTANTANVLLKDCVLQSVDKPVFAIYGSGCLAVNLCGFITSTSSEGCRVMNGAKAIGCTVVRDSGVSNTGTGVVSAYANSTLQSCAFFGFSTVASASAWDTTASKYNATDQASGLPGTNNQHSVTYNSTSPFTNATAASLNLIPVASTTLAANGFRDATNAPNDITGTARSATPTIGDWEITASGPTTYFKTLAAVVAVTPALSHRATDKRAIAAAVAAVPVLAHRATNKRALSAQVATVPVLSKRETNKRTLSAAVALVSSLAKRVTYKRTLAGIVAVTPALTHRSTWKRILSAAVAAVSALAHRATSKRAMAAQVATAPALAHRATNKRGLSAAVAVTPVLSKHQVQAKSLPATVVAVAGLARKQIQGRILVAAVALLVNLSRRNTFRRILSAQVAVVPSLARRGTWKRALAAVVALVPGLAHRATSKRAIAAAVALTPTLSKGHRTPKTLTASVALTPALSRQKTTPRALAAQLAAVPGLFSQMTFSRRLAAVVAVLPTLRHRSTWGRALSAVVRALGQLVIKSGDLYDLVETLELDSPFETEMEMTSNFETEMEADSEFP